MKLLSSTDFAIASALKTGTLRTIVREGRFGPFVAIEDAFGVIEVADDAAEAETRIGAIRAALN